MVITQPIKQFIELATICWRQSRIVGTLDKSDGDIKRLEREVDRFGRVLKACDIEINDYEGRKNNNLNVETASIELSEDVTDEIIFETIQPEIKYKGDVQQKSRVVVHKPFEGDGPMPATPAESQIPQAPQAPTEENTATIEESLSRQTTPNHAQAKGRGPVFAWLAVLSCAVVVVAALSFSNIIDERDLINDGLMQVIEEKDTVIDELRQVIAEKNETIDEKDARIATLEESGKNEDQHPANPTDEDSVAMSRYTVQAGDTLYSIMAEHNLDYAESVRFVQHINGIANPNEIYVGQVLYLPER